jgi:hypothetical protein
MAQLRETASERKAESRIFRRSEHVDKAHKSFRLAGDIFRTDRVEKSRKSSDESRRRLQAVRPVGVGFGTEDRYGPDENWDTKDPIEHTPAPGYYKSYKNF